MGFARGLRVVGGNGILVENKEKPGSVPSAEPTMSH